MLYLGQHRKLLAQLERVRVRLRERPAPRALPQRVIGLLDLETTYKHLSEHHDQAEANGLFKALDTSMPASERDWLVQRCSDEFRLALNLELPLLRRAREWVATRAPG